ncbi:RAD52 motif-containing protein 1-like [Hippopotamus amphibius kiboko]|uniref:RAD52 motif-containing protein 1-like n=1 Tax=Hippopotamus amphibius kiboko TaxID=575201 RepID=UPI002596F438|nr:RAD52 motif-containing protein 1-like [Hippopotamus amphibius kiboko]
MAEKAPFAVPTRSDKTLLLWELSSGPTAEALQHSPFTAFSQFGLLYSFGVFPNAAVAGPRFCAIIKFYSARDAHRAQKACDQKQLFQASPSEGGCKCGIPCSTGMGAEFRNNRPWEFLGGPVVRTLHFHMEKLELRMVRNLHNNLPYIYFYMDVKCVCLTDSFVSCSMEEASSSSLSNCLFRTPFTSQKTVRLGTRRKAVQHNALALNSSRCQELANYYFGFSGWSKRIIKLQNLSNLEERENEDPVAPLQKQSLKFFCALEVVLPNYECRSPGVGMAEEPLDKLEEGPLSLLMKRKVTQKLAVQKAMTDAIQKLLIVVLGDGKVHKNRILKAVKSFKRGKVDSSNLKPLLEKMDLKLTEKEFEELKENLSVDGMHSRYPCQSPKEVLSKSYS